MKKAEVRIGETYLVKVSGKLARVRVTGESPYGGWVGENLATRREVRIRSAQRLRRPAGRPAEEVFRGAFRRALAGFARNAAESRRPEGDAPPEPKCTCGEGEDPKLGHSAGCAKRLAVGG